jgi:hypothetical protein
MNNESLDSFFSSFAQVWLDKFGAAVAGFYKIGSLAHGGFSPIYSDIDLAVFFKSRPNEANVQNVIDNLKERGSPIADKLSVFWSDSKFTFGRFPVPDQIDVIDNGIPFLSSGLTFSKHPHRNDLRAYLREHSIPYWRKKTDLFSKSLPDRGSPEEKELLRCVLYPARLIYTWETNKITSNDHAVNYLEKKKGLAVALEPLQMALAIRNVARPFSPSLFDSHLLRHQMESTLEYIGKDDATLGD